MFLIICIIMIIHATLRSVHNSQSHKPSVILKKILDFLKILRLFQYFNKVLM